MSIFSCRAALTKFMSPGLHLVQSIFSSLSALTKLMLTCLSLITVWHHDLSQPVQASFSQSEEVYYRSHITIMYCNRLHAIMVRRKITYTSSFRYNPFVTFVTFCNLYILRKTIEGYLDLFPSLTFKQIMHAFHSSWYLQPKWMFDLSHASMIKVQYMSKWYNPLYWKVKKNQKWFKPIFIVCIPLWLAPK